MHKILFYILLLILQYPIFTEAQRAQVSLEEKEIAKQEKRKHQNDDFLITNTETTYTFSRSRSKTNAFSMLESTTKNIMCINERLESTYSNAVYYDGTSSIEQFYAFNKKEKKDVAGIVSSHETYSSDGIFHEDAKLFTYSISFKELGEVENYKLDLSYTDPKYLCLAFFHDDYPINKSTLTFIVPEWADVEFILMNMDDYSLQKAITQDPSKKNTVHSFTINNIPADKSEINQPSALAFLPHIIIVHKSYKKIDGSTEYVFNDSKGLYKWYSSIISLVNNDKTVINPLVQKLISNQTTDYNKIETLFYWVQENIRYIAFEDGIAAFKPASCQDVYNNKFGDCKGMANLLKNMLIIAGYDARLTWVGTNHIPYNSHAIPALVVDNHMICTLFLNNKRYFLDPTESYIGLNDYASRIQGREVLIENGEDFIIDTIPSFNKEHNKIVIEQELKLSNNQLQGSSHDVYYGEGKTNILRAYNTSRSDERNAAIKRSLDKNDKNISVTNIFSSSMDDRSKPVNFNYEITYKNQVVNDNQDKYISIDYDKEFINFTFDTLRLKDYIFDYKYQLNKHVRFEVPNGYTVKHLPSNLNKVTNDFSFIVSFKEENGYVIYNKEISFDNSIIRKKDFKILNQTTKDLKKIYNDQLIITAQ